MVERFALDGYRVEELIGFGGSGEVWRARQADTGDTVALKRLRVRGAAATERLRREAALLATVAGPHVIAVRRLLVEGDEAVLVMDFAAGGSLAGVLAARGMLPAAEVVTVLAPIAAALAAAHARDLVHGDLSPANILFAADGRPLLADFGVAQAVGASATGVHATVDYLDPAVGEGAPVGPASDVYALGAVGFVALAGAPVWGTGTADQVSARAAIGIRAPLAELAPAAPAPLVEVIETMLALDPDDRPDARSAAGAILRASAAAPVGLVTTRAPVPPPLTERVGPRPGTAASGTPDEVAATPATRRDTRSAPRRGPMPSAPRRWPASVRRWPASARTTVAIPVLLVALVTAVALAIAAGGGLSRLVGAARAGASTAATGRATAAAAPPAAATSPDVPTSPSGPASASPTLSVTSGSSISTIAPVTSGATVGPAGWLGVVRRLDALRASAFAAGQPSLLAAVYVPGSAAYATDLATLRSLASRGLRARGFTATVADVGVEQSGPGSERLRVVDRLSGYELVDAAGDVVGRGAARPARAFSMWLTDDGGSWRVRAIGPA